MTAWTSRQLPGNIPVKPKPEDVYVLRYHKQETPEDYFDVRCGFRDALLEDLAEGIFDKNKEHATTKEYLTSMASEKGEALRTYESAFLGGAIDAICSVDKLKPLKLPFIVKELLCATPYKMDPSAKGLNSTFREFCEDTENVLYFGGNRFKEIYFNGIFRDSISKPLLIEEFTTTILESDEPVDPGFIIPENVRDVYNYLTGKGRGKDMKPYLKKYYHSVIYSIEQYVNRHNISPDNEIQVKKVADFYKNIFGDREVESQMLLDMFRETAYIMKGNRFKPSELSQEI